ncbi:MAG: sulfotransferase [Nocardioidaceae bacterium]
MSRPRLFRALTRQVDRHAPRGLVTWARSAARGVGTLTARWRMTPSFIVVGAQRAGTTTLYRVLSEHPSVMRPTVSKGIGYFDLSYDRGPRWYRGHFPLTWSGRRRAGADAVTFESSGYYLFHPLAAERIARDLPGVRLVVMVREPVERAYSAHRHELARGFETEEFERALELEPERTEGEREKMLADPSYQSFEHRHHSYLARSRYSEQIVRLQEAVGADRVWIVDADRFFEQPHEEFELLRAWLGLAPWRPTSVEQWNARPRDPLSPELRSRLTDYFEPFDRVLAEQMGRTPRWRESAAED